MEGYKDLKFSTIAKKLEEYLKEQNLNDIPLKEFENRLEEAVNAFMKANHYPLHCVIEDVREIDLLMENGKKAAEIRVRYDLTRKKSIRDRKYYFKSLVKTGPCFDRKLSEIIGRRVLGISYGLDKIAYEAGKLGYSSIDEMIKAYEEAEKVIKDVQFLKLNYEYIPKEEKKKYFS